MIINKPDPVTKPVEDYDFVFTNGTPFSITLDINAGDQADFSEPGLVIFRLTPKITIDGEGFYPAEDVTVFSTHILTMHHRVREVQEITAAQREEWAKILKGEEIPATVQ